MGHGYELMAEDYRFIDKMLNSFNQSDYKAILRRYLEEWQSGMAEAQSSIMEQGEGRRRANKWLIERCELRKDEIRESREPKKSWNECFD